jgi:tetratricopeptide (TPR) repeat protein
VKRSILAVPARTLVPLVLVAVLGAMPSFAQTAANDPAASQMAAKSAPKKPDAAAPAGAATTSAPSPATSSGAAPADKTPAATSSKPAAPDSLALLERAVARDSSKFDNLYRLGVMYLDRDRVSEATRVLLKARQLKPKNHRLLVNLGAAFDAAGQPATAQTYYREALAVAPGDSVATCRLASSLYAQANYKDAMKLLRSMIGKSGGTGAYCAYFTLGVAFADAGIYRDAIRMWKKVIEIAPNSPEANSARESIEVLQKFVKS